MSTTATSTAPTAQPAIAPIRAIDGPSSWIAKVSSGSGSGRAASDSWVSWPAPLPSGKAVGGELWRAAAAAAAGVTAPGAAGGGVEVGAGPAAPGTLPGAGTGAGTGVGLGGVVTVPAADAAGTLPTAGSADGTPGTTGRASCPGGPTSGGGGGGGGGTFA